VIDIDAVSLPVEHSSSRTVIVTENVPTHAKMRQGVMPEPLVPSPKLHDQATIVPSGSIEPAPFIVMDVSVCVAWFGPASARGA
jgi:hypothetical protein